MNNIPIFKVKKTLLRLSLILGAVLFCIIALLQMPSASSLLAHSTQPEEFSTNRPEATATRVSFPIKHIITTEFEGVNDIDAADLDGDEDGKVEIIAGSLNDKGFTWWKASPEDGEGSQWSSITFSGAYSGTRAIHAVDIDNDKDIDIVGAAFYSNSIVLWKNNGNAGWTEEAIVEDLNFAYDVYGAKLDNDSDVDILAAAKKGDIIWAENNNGPSSWATQTVATYDEIDNVRAVIADKINRNDNDYDVVGVSFTGDNIIWWKNIDGEEITWEKDVIESDFELVKSVDTAQMNQGDTDVDVLASGDNGIAWWQNIHMTNNNIGWGKQIVVEDIKVKSAIAADLDNDDDMDILAAGEEGVAWWENLNGEGTTWDRHDVDLGFSEAKVVRAVDINGDTSLDILAAGDGTIAWWQILPDAPELAPIVNEDRDGNYDVNWSTEQEVMTYTLQEDDNPDFSSPISETTDMESYPISGKTSGTYYYQVQAENEIGQSAWSDFVSVTVPFPLYIPMLRLDPSPTPTPTPSCIEVEDEPNDSRDQADRKPPPCEGESLLGTLPENDDDDFYRILIKSDGKLDVELINIPQDTNYNLYLYQINVKDAMAKSINPGNSDEKINHDVSPGTYYLRVYPFQGRSDQEYSLKWELSP